MDDWPKIEWVDLLVALVVIVYVLLCLEFFLHETCLIQQISIRIKTILTCGTGCFCTQFININRRTMMNFRHFKWHFTRQHAIQICRFGKDFSDRHLEAK